MLGPSCPSNTLSQPQSLIKKSTVSLQPKKSTLLKSRLTILDSNISIRPELLREFGHLESHEVFTDRPRLYFPDITQLVSDRSQECSMLGMRPKEFLIRKSGANNSGRGSLTSRAQRSVLRPPSRVRNQPVKTKESSEDIKRQFNLEKRHSERNLAKFQVHLQTVSCFSNRFKERYFEIVSNLDKIRLRQMELQMEARKENLTNGMKNQYAELFDGEARVKSLEDMAKLRTRALKVHEIVNNHKIWTHK
jgi:hypothetical protein